jgi:hypothetical protein
MPVKAGNAPLERLAARDGSIGVSYGESPIFIRLNSAEAAR